MSLCCLHKWKFGCKAVVVLGCLFVNAVIYADQEAETSPIESSKKLPQQCSANCETQYGSVLGQSPAGVSAYSNCNADCVIFEPHHFDDIYTGIKWQCVEYARRWLLQERGVVFGDVDIAADIWVMQEVSNPVTKQSYKFNSYVNGAEALPIRGDLLIYGKDYLGTGHVAVVVAIDEEKQTIQVAEQNYANTTWHKQHAREITFIKQSDRYWLLDSFLIGWKRFSEEKH